MSNVTSGTTARRPTEEEFAKIVRSLNADYGLQLCGPDVSESPSKSRLQRQTEEQRQGYSLYQRLRVIHYSGRLPLYHGRFVSEAQKFFRFWVDKPLADPDTLPDISAPLGARSAEERAALRRLLQEILAKPETPGQRRPAKRLSDESNDDGISRRTRSRLSGGPGDDYDVIDSIPFRSKPRPNQRPKGHEPHPRHEHVTTASEAHSPSFMSRSATSSRASFNSTVFSSVPAAEETPASSWDTNAKFIQDYTPCPQEYEALNESFANHEDESGVTPTQRRQHEVEVEGAFPSGNNGCPPDFDTPDHCSIKPLAEVAQRQSQGILFASLPDLDRTDINPVIGEGPAPGLLEQRLGNVWPTFPIPGLNEAPLAIIWEVTRAAVHCGVDLRYFDLNYSPAETWWHNQNMLRSELSKHRLFMGKGLPPRSNAAAWDAALNGFQSQDKAVVLSAELVYRHNEEGPLFEVKPQSLELRLSHRLDRRFGADRFLEVTMPSPISADQPPQLVKDDAAGSDKIIKWLCNRMHYFLGRSWGPFFTRAVKKSIKDTNDPKKTRDVFLEQVYFFATDGNHFRNPEVAESVPPLEEARALQSRTKLSRSGLLDWAINLRHNAKQPVPKLFSRISLSLSRTYPTVVLKRHQIRHQTSDILSMPDQQGERRVMNDGIGRISRQLANKIASYLGLLDTPSGFQGRFGSAKGMWIMDVDDGLGNEDWIETYPSQRKWYCDFEDPCHRTFEVRSWPNELRPALLNQQFIPILEARSLDPTAMRRVIADHLVHGLSTELDTQKASLDHPMDLRLWMQKSGLVSKNRLFHGHVPFLGGMPDKDEDKVSFLLDSGFDPKHTKLLNDIIWKLRQNKTELLRTKLKIQVPCSAYAYMVADFAGILAPNEVHLSFSSKFQVEGFSDTLLEDMDILVARAPAHFPSDIQKVRVVSKPHLRKLKDVVVFPTTGIRPLADFLSGGDYDGDIAWVCWDRDIVSNFCNAPALPEYDFVQEGFLRKQNWTFDDLLDGHRNLDIACKNFLYMGLTFNMQPSLLGRCTKYKERLCYHQGSVSSEQAALLSVLVSNLVDQAKAGITFTEEDWLRFRKDRLNRRKAFDEPEYAKERASGSWRMKRGKIHVLDYLRFSVAEDVIERALTDFSRAINAKGAEQYDSHLTRLYNELEVRAQGSQSSERLAEYLCRNIQALGAKWTDTMRLDVDTDFQEQVKRICYQWVNIAPPDDLQTSKTISQLNDPWSLYTDMRDTYNLFGSPHSNDWSAAFSPWTLLKASATFKLFYSQKYKFVWYVAGRQLAMIKSRIMASSPSLADTAPVLVGPEMWAALKPDKKVITTLAARRGAGESDSLSALSEVTDVDDDGTVIDDS